MRLKKDNSEQKLNGAYYTPEYLAKKIVELFNLDDIDSVLEPSCGDGVFINAIKSIPGFDFNGFIDAIEINPEETCSLVTKFKNDEKINIYTDDFFHYFSTHVFSKYDLIIGNPPYIRYQYLTEAQRHLMSTILSDSGMRPNKLINAWVCFLVACVRMLSENGKIAFIIPAEIMQVAYAEDLRKFLSNNLSKITLLTFKKLVFPDIEQEIVIFVGEKGREEKGIRIIEMKDLLDFNTLDLSSNGFQKLSHNKEKWTKYFADADENNLVSSIRKDSRFTALSDIALINVGITTGNNSFFSVDKKTADQYDLGSVVRPMIGRSSHAKSILFTHDEWINNVNEGKAANFLDFPDIDLAQLPAKHQEYISQGVKTGANEGYKCSIREHWYAVPSVWVPDAFLLRRSCLYPKFVLNKCNAVSTDTMHRIKFNDGIDPETALLSYYNSITFAFTEICARSYGGGVLEILPREAGNVYLPIVQNIPKDEIFRLVDEIDKIIKNDEDIECVLDIVDKYILRDKLGINEEHCVCARNLWKKLRGRRLERGAKLVG